jgi:hypothetical protein
MRVTALTNGFYVSLKREGAPPTEDATDGLIYAH